MPEAVVLINSDGSEITLSSCGAASMGNGQVSISDTATLIVAANATRRGVIIVNHGTTDVYIGAPTVTTSAGLLLAGTKGASISLGYKGAVQGIVATGSQVISYLEVYD